MEREIIVLINEQGKQEEIYRKQYIYIYIYERTSKGINECNAWIISLWVKENTQSS